MRKSLLSTCLLLVLSTAVSAAPPAMKSGTKKKPKPGPLPDGVAAIVHGQKISMDRFRALVLSRFGPTSQGKKILDNFVTDRIVEMEREKRGIEITDQEVDSYIAKVEKEIEQRSGGTKKLKDVLAEKGLSEKEFRKNTKEFLVRERMAAQDLQSSGEVGVSDLDIWVDSLKKKYHVQVGGSDLPKGVCARIGKTNVTDADFEDALMKRISGDRLSEALWDLVIATRIQQRLKASGTKVTPEDAKEAVDRLKQRFEHDPRFSKTHVQFSQYVQAVRHMTVAQLEKDPMFLGQVGLVKDIRANLSEDEVRAYWKAHADRYGERRRFLHLLIRADEKPSAFGRIARTPAAAKKIIDRLLVQYENGTPFRKLVAENSEAKSKTVKPDTPMEVSRATSMPQALRTAIFSAPVGKVVGPVKTIYGYHLIEVLKVIPAPTFAQVEPEVRDDLVAQKRSEALLHIRQDSKIQLRQY